MQPAHEISISFKTLNVFSKQHALEIILIFLTGTKWCRLVHQPWTWRKIQLQCLGFVPIHVTNSTAEDEGEDKAQTLYDGKGNANTNNDAQVAFQQVNQFINAALKQIKSKQHWMKVIKIYCFQKNGLRKCAVSK